MTLGALLGSAQLLPEARSIATEPGTAELRVTAIAHDSRTVTPGTLFVAVPGQHADGATFAPLAITKGAVAVVAESSVPAGTRVPWVQTSNARLALAELSAVFYGRPSEELTVIGVTGTNGKTTTTYLLAAVMDAAGRPCGRLGTVSVRTGPVPGDEIDASHTTPESNEVQRLLR